MEQDKHFLQKAKEYLGDNTKVCCSSSCPPSLLQVGRLFCSGLQNFDFVAETYDVIWCQWVLGHLTDEHLQDFFVRCGQVTGRQTVGLETGHWRL